MNPFDPKPGEHENNVKIDLIVAVIVLYHQPEIHIEARHNIIAAI